jgi:hypothetical protein
MSWRSAKLCWQAPSRKRGSPSSIENNACQIITSEPSILRLESSGTFAVPEAIDVTTYGRQRDKLREELTLAKIDHHAEAVDELDVEGILALAERILPRASDLWVQASLDYKQRLQQLFFPEGIAFDGNRFNRTAATAPL